MSSRIVSDHIKQRREELGLTQEYVARKAGISRVYLSMIERHEADIDDCAFKIVRGLAEVLKIDLYEITSTPRLPEPNRKDPDSGRQERALAMIRRALDEYDGVDQP